MKSESFHNYTEKIRSLRDQGKPDHPNLTPDFTMDGVEGYVIREQSPGGKEGQPAVVLRLPGGQAVKFTANDLENLLLKLH